MKTVALLVMLSVFCASLGAEPPAARLAVTSPSAPLPQRLTEAGLYVADSIRVRGENIAFAPQYPLWSDGTSKRRWIYLPPGTAIDASRVGHGLVVYRNRFFAMGGEQRDFDRKWKQIDKVLGQLESYDPRTDQWQSHAPMMTPRHGLGAAVLGDWIHVAGGGPVVDGSMQSSIHEAFTLG